jgi:peroxiredoxin
MSLPIGQSAPDFTLANQHGQRVSLSDFEGRKAVVLVFYPFAFSGVCTGELHELRDHLGDFSDERTELLAVSCDHMFSLRAYAERDGYEFSLLSDFWPHGEVARRYGIFDERAGCASRGTFVIDDRGVLQWQVTSEMGTARDLGDYREALAAVRDVTAGGTP